MGETHIDTHVPCLRHPVPGNACRPKRRQPVNIARAAAATVVHIARQHGLVRRVADQEHAFDGVKGRAGEFRERVDGGGRALAVAFEDDAFRGVGGEEGLDFLDDLGNGKLVGWV